MFIPHNANDPSADVCSLEIDASCTIVYLLSFLFFLNLRIKLRDIVIKG